MSEAEKTEATFLGKKTDYKFHYDKTLILPIPRDEERSKIGIDSNNLLFKGFDVWNCYEFSTLNQFGTPVVGILKLVYPCDSKYLVESKSLKLYLNGYSMTKTGSDSIDCLAYCQKQISQDLSEALQTNVKAHIYRDTQWETPILKLANPYTDLSKMVASDIVCDIYKEDPTLLKVAYIDTANTEKRVFSSLVRSCCKITHQPDFGTYYIKYYGTNHIDEASLLKYLVSFRDEWHFHEECTELVYKRLHDLLKPDQLCVACFYTRRGGIDINIVRSSSMLYAKEWDDYVNVLKQSFKLPRQ